MLDDRDGSRALLVDLDRGRSVFLTPAGQRFHGAQFGLLDGYAVLMVAEDVDGDGRFETSEAPTQWLLELGSTEPATPLLRPEVRGRVTSIAGGGAGGCI